MADLPRVDVVLISHNHYDHLDLVSVRALYRQAGGPPIFYVPLGVDAWLTARLGAHSGAHITALDWWDYVDHGGVDLHFLPVQHSSWRRPWDRNATLWGAWAVRHPDFNFFFAGDLAYSPDVRDIGRAMGGFGRSRPSGSGTAPRARRPRWR